MRDKLRIVVRNRSYYGKSNIIIKGKTVDRAPATGLPRISFRRFSRGKLHLGLIYVFYGRDLGRF